MYELSSNHFSDLIFLYFSTYSTSIKIVNFLKHQIILYMSSLSPGMMGFGLRAIVCSHLHPSETSLVQLSEGVYAISGT
jgi:hypothetical protein